MNFEDLLEFCFNLIPELQSPSLKASILTYGFDID